MGFDLIGEGTGARRRRMPLDWRSWRINGNSGAGAPERPAAGAVMKGQNVVRNPAITLRPPCGAKPHDRGRIADFLVRQVVAAQVREPVRRADADLVGEHHAERRVAVRREIVVGHAMLRPRMRDLRTRRTGRNRSRPRASRAAVRCAAAAGPCRRCAHACSRQSVGRVDRVAAPRERAPLAVQLDAVELGAHPTIDRFVERAVARQRDARRRRSPRGPCCTRSGSSRSGCRTRRRCHGSARSARSAGADRSSRPAFDAFGLPIRNWPVASCGPFEYSS